MQERQFCIHKVHKHKAELYPTTFYPFLKTENGKKTGLASPKEQQQGCIEIIKALGFYFRAFILFSVRDVDPGLGVC